jgi:hypothetical protein
MEEIPTEDFAVAKAEPRLQKTNAQVTPMKPKNYIVVIVEGIVKCDRNMDGEEEMGGKTIKGRGAKKEKNYKWAFFIIKG